MKTKLSNLSVAKSRFDGLELVHAQNLHEKQAVYDLRLLCEKEHYPDLRSRAQVIDEKDNRADHLYIRSVKNNNVMASIRICQADTQTRQLSSIYRHDLLVFGEPLIHFTENDFSEADKMYTNPNSNLSSIELQQTVYLAAIAFARLRFHKFLLSKMSCTIFKTLRTKGLLFEQTSYALLDNDTSAYFYCSTDDGVSQNSEAWELYQHFLDKLAPQLNQPDIISHNSGSSFQSQG